MLHLLELPYGISTFWKCNKAYRWASCFFISFYKVYSFLQDLLHFFCWPIRTHKNKEPSSWSSHHNLRLTAILCGSVDLSKDLPMVYHQFSIIRLDFINAIQFWHVNYKPLAAENFIKLGLCSQVTLKWFCLVSIWYTSWILKSSTCSIKVGGWKFSCKYEMFPEVLESAEFGKFGSLSMVVCSSNNSLLNFRYLKGA